MYIGQKFSISISEDVQSTAIDHAVSFCGLGCGGPRHSIGPDFPMSVWPASEVTEAAVATVIFEATQHVYHIIQCDTPDTNRPACKCTIHTHVSIGQHVSKVRRVRTRSPPNTNANIESTSRPTRCDVLASGSHARVRVLPLREASAVNPKPGAVAAAVTPTASHSIPALGTPCRP